MSKYYAYVIPVKKNDETVTELWLCSKDITVGDQFDSANGWDFICTRVEEHYVWSKGGLSHNPEEEVCHHKKWAYKKIGKVSPDAEWVRNGMVFEEKDIEVPYGPILFYGNNLQHWSKVRDEHFQYIKFRCPSSSKHFH